MVIQENSEGWQCSYCNKEYESYDDAYDCIKECLMINVDEPIKYNGSNEWICEYCNKIHSNKLFAILCEEKHLDDQDIYYQNKIQHENRVILNLAATHSSQQRL